MRRVAFVAMLVLVSACETRDCRYLTNGFMEIGQVQGKVSFYAVDPDDYYLLRNVDAFLSRSHFASMPSYHNAMAYVNDIIVRIASIGPDGEYFFPDVPPGLYYLNIGAFESPWFDFMSYHSTMPRVDVRRGEVLYVEDIELLPGGVMSLVWYLDGRDSTCGGFSFSEGTNVSFPDSSDLWYDGANQKLVASGNRIAPVPSEQEGLCYIGSAPDTGYASELYIPMPRSADGASHFVVRTLGGNYAKCIRTAGEYGSSDGSVWYRRIDIQWMLQPDGSKSFSY